MDSNISRSRANAAKDVRSFGTFQASIAAEAAVFGGHMRGNVIGQKARLVFGQHPGETLVTALDIISFIDHNMIQYGSQSVHVSRADCL